MKLPQRHGQWALTNRSECALNVGELLVEVDCASVSGRLLLSRHVVTTRIGKYSRLGQ